MSSIDETSQIDLKARGRKKKNEECKINILPPSRRTVSIILGTEGDSIRQIGVEYCCCLREFIGEETMVSANREMAVYCFDTLLAHFNNEQVPHPAFDEGQHPLFVTWKKAVNGEEPRLRGCIGTLEARAIINGFKDYALTSALRDRRFPPIQAKELPFLECTVSILTNYESDLGYLDWEVGKHGMIIEFTDPGSNTRRSATYLPEVAAHEGWTEIEAIDSLIRKAGYNGPITDSVRNRIKLTRYQSTLFTMHYSDYVNFVKTARGTAPFIAGSKPH